MKKICSYTVLLNFLTHAATPSSNLLETIMVSPSLLNGFKLYSTNFRCTLIYVYNESREIIGDGVSEGGGPTL